VFEVFLISNFRLVLNIYIYFFDSSPASEFAYEDGTDRVFRNVGIYNSDAGELPKENTTNG